MTRLLLVEDDDHQRLLYREDLETEGYEVFEERDGSRVLAAIERHAPDAVVLDINMPGPDGLTTLARIHDKHHRLPVILHSAYSAYHEQFRSWLADAYVTKSSDPTGLRTAVRSALAKARPHD
ncbi:MAG: response regulator [Deltaproteobacteria bacterium]|nr:response regulator [Deltaproteobacteria bacterium]